MAHQASWPWLSGWIQTGKQSIVADSLSRVNKNNDTAPHFDLQAITIVEIPCLQDIRKLIQSDMFYASIDNKLQEHTNTPSKYTKVNGIYYYKGRILIRPQAQAFKTTLLEEFHTSPLAGHWGVLENITQIEASLPPVRTEKRRAKLCSSLDICQRMKLENVNTPGLLQPLPIPEQVWEEISMDFITQLPPCKQYSVILVVVDRLSKYAHFIPLAHPFTTPMAAALFFDHVVKLHGLPKSIVSDRDAIFTSLIWQEHFKIQGSKLALSSSYHPQSDGQTEITNKTL